MKKNCFKLFFTFILGLTILAGCGNSISTSDSKPSSSPTSTSTSTAPKDYFNEMQSVFLIGQSNMAGRGNINIVDEIKDERIHMMRNLSWVDMKEPIHDDKPSVAGAGLAASFAKGFVETFDCDLGLIPGAYGGTSLSQWKKGAQYYNRALEMAKAAQKDSNICAFLWHQGESDQKNENYGEELQSIFDSFIEDLNLDETKLVIITGELGEFRTESTELVHNGLNQLKDVYTNYGIASSKGLTAQDVTTHFDSPSLRVFGYRYFDIFHKFITGNSYEYDDNPLNYLKKNDSNNDNGGNKNNGDYIAEVNFDDWTVGTKYQGVDHFSYKNTIINTDSSSNFEVKASLENKSDLYLDCYCGKAGQLPYIDLLNQVDNTKKFAVEAKFMVSSNFSGTVDLLKLVQTDPSTASIPLVYLGSNKALHDFNGSKKGDSLNASLSEFEWSHIKVVVDLQNNKKDIYLNGVLYQANMTLSTTNNATESFNVATTRLQFKGGTGSVIIDEYKCYLV